MGFGRSRSPVGASNKSAQRKALGAVVAFVRRQALERNKRPLARPCHYRRPFLIGPGITTAL